MVLTWFEGCGFPRPKSDSRPHQISGAKGSLKAEIVPKRFKTKTKTQVVAGSELHLREKRQFCIDVFLLRSLRLLKDNLSGYISEDFRYDWLFKQWGKIRRLEHYLPVKENFTVLNYKRVFNSVKTIRIPRTEPYLRQLFEDRLRLSLPKASPITRAEVDKIDDACFDRYTSDKTFKIRNTEAFYRALDQTLMHSGFMQNRSFKLYSFDEAVQLLPKDTSSCYPVMVRKNNSEAKSEAYRFIKDVFSTAENPSIIMRRMHSYVVVVFHRTQVLINSLKPFRFDTKVRQVFGLSYGLLALECMLFGNFYQGVVESARHFAIGCTRPQVSATVKRVASSGKRYVICGDLSKFDSTIPPEMVMLYFSCVIQCSRLPGNLKTLASCLAHYLTFTPFMGSSCRVRYMVGGNTSGSYSTSLLNSFVVLLALQYAHMIHFGVTTDDVSVLGDDFIIAVDDDTFLKTIDSVFSDWNINLNVKKTVVSDLSKREEIHFLGFEWEVYGYTPDQTLKWIVSHVVYPERNIEGISGFDRVIYRLCSVIFQIRSGPSIFDRLIRGYRRFYEVINESSGTYPIMLITDDGRLSEQKIPFHELYNYNWTLF
jgi:hypothetical protein